MRKFIVVGVVGGLMTAGAGALLMPAHADSTCQAPWAGYPASAGSYSDATGSGAQACVTTGTQDGTVTAVNSGSGGYVAADGLGGDPLGGYVAVDDTGVYGCWTGEYQYGSSTNNSLIGTPDPSSPCAPAPPSAY